MPDAGETPRQPGEAPAESPISPNVQPAPPTSAEQEPPPGGEGSEQDPRPPSPDASKMLFEDYFPKLDLTDEEEKSIASWFNEDLKACVKNVNKNLDKWGLFRAVFMLEYVEKFYPNSGVGADFSSGLLMDHVLRGMSRLKAAVFKAYPLFAVDDRTSGTEDITFIHRAQWFLHTVMTEDLGVNKAIGNDGIFDFILDGSLIMEADQMYEKVPQRSLETFFTEDDLISAGDTIVDPSDLGRALQDIQNGEPARVLVEKEILTKNGLQLFHVAKADHLVPPNVYRDEDIRFRARRMFLTRSDLELLGSKNVGWYPKKKVERVLGNRAERRTIHRMAASGDDSALHVDGLNRTAEGDLSMGWRGKEDLSADQRTQAYKDTWAVYRVTCKFGYKAGNDKEGVIPKWCKFDYEPESGTILRAVTYPHFHERPDYFHFKMGFVPNSYYGLGYGARLLNDDFIESNAIDLYLEGAAMATFRPFIAVHPDEGGRTPFLDGLGPGKIGFVRNPSDFQPFEIPAPPAALVQHIVPLIKARTENRTGITSLVQGRTESSDPRSPAQKTQLLLKEAFVTLDDQIADWDSSGWEPLADFVWRAQGEKMVYQGVEAFEDVITFPRIDPSLEQVNRITKDELLKKVVWKSQASSEFINDDLRTQKFIRHFQFYMPVLQGMAQVRPDLYAKYFPRWLRWSAQEFNLRGAGYLIPSAQEFNDIPPEQLMAVSQAIMQNLLSNRAENQDLQGSLPSTPNAAPAAPPAAPPVAPPAAPPAGPSPVGL